MSLRSVAAEPFRPRGHTVCMSEDSGQQAQPQPAPPEPAPDTSWVKEVDIRHDATKGNFRTFDSGGQSTEGG